MNMKNFGLISEAASASFVWNVDAEWYAMLNWKRKIILIGRIHVFKQIFWQLHF